MTRKLHHVIPLDAEGRAVDLGGTQALFLDLDDGEHAEAQLVAKLADLHRLADRRHGLAVARLRVVDPDRPGDAFDWAP